MHESNVPFFDRIVTRLNSFFSSIYSGIQHIYINYILSYFQQNSPVLLVSPSLSPSSPTPQIYQDKKEATNQNHSNIKPRQQKNNPNTYPEKLVQTSRIASEMETGMDIDAIIRKLANKENRKTKKHKRKELKELDECETINASLKDMQTLSPSDRIKKKKKKNNLPKLMPFEFPGFGPGGDMFPSSAISLDSNSEVNQTPNIGLNKIAISQIELRSPTQLSMLPTPEPSPPPPSPTISLPSSLYSNINEDNLPLKNVVIRAKARALQRVTRDELDFSPYFRSRLEDGNVIGNSMPTQTEFRPINLIGDDLNFTETEEERRAYRDERILELSQVIHNFPNVFDGDLIGNLVGESYFLSSAYDYSNIFKRSLETMQANIFFSIPLTLTNSSFNNSGKENDIPIILATANMTRDTISNDYPTDQHNLQEHRYLKMQFKKYNKRNSNTSTSGTLRPLSDNDLNRLNASRGETNTAIFTRVNADNQRVALFI